MKKVIFNIFIATIFLTACNNNSNSTADNNTSSDKPATTSETTPSASLIGGIVDGYLQLSDALAQDNDKNAAEAGKNIVEAMNGLDKSSFTPEQTEVYNEIEVDAKEHAEHISENVGNLKHQREHFDMLSNDVYDLVKTFGAGQTLYQANCPMYNNNKGANWLTASKDINNPYMGSEMKNCGTIKEELK